ncbi:hypothetical protein A6V39_00585 [Candidatus Mycoplasma haematobovis]|uniref:Uncharacterized protein n=1 Tax=Candidatus Mycoplasma haematobovis TaxID=432608 RepID=A0A1A9QDI9_9MOLU|nr:hypothetical protein [Candidatus Mycoplasma haematobovis]OAL10547.1 hypothetical protein A6V39_00585 [Candidatus Mycoplasma haematobovis]
MQLRFTSPLVTRVAGSSFKSSISAVLSGMTAVGTLTAVALNSGNTGSTILESLDPVKKALLNDTLLNGIQKVTETFKEWGSAIVGSKDAFKEWLDSYLGPDGFKSGTVTLYQKLNDWGLIVYRWFRDKFWKFITNIPDMVQNWRKLRLSLFKWGTFLGGGGGSALWAMFGSGDNWDKLGELMGRPDFEEIMGDLGKLMENNSDAFEKMDTEEVKEIFEKFLHETDEAKEATKELLKKQEERQKDKSEEEKEKEQLTEEEIQERFKPPSGGNPLDTKAVFGNMVSGGLKKLVGLFNSKSKSSIEGKSPYLAAIEGMKDYIDLIDKDIKQEQSRKKEGTPKQQFAEVIKENKFAFISAIAGVAEKAYRKLPTPQSNGKEVTEKEMAEAFMKEFENSFTKKALENEEGDFDMTADMFVRGK